MVVPNSLINKNDESAAHTAIALMAKIMDRDVEIEVPEDWRIPEALESISISTNQALLRV